MVDVREVSLVEAPRCPKCNAAMVHHDDLHWICIADGCSQGTVPASDSGIFPFTKIDVKSPPLPRPPTPGCLAEEALYLAERFL